MASISEGRGWFTAGDLPAKIAGSVALEPSFGVLRGLYLSQGFTRGYFVGIAAVAHQVQPA